MDYEQLRIFISVVENGSFTKAAETMYISHSTTSRNVSALEESLGTGLLIRDSRGLRLTEAGSLLFREGKLLLEKTEELENKVRNVESGETGKLSAASIFLCSGERSELFEGFCSKYPELVLGIYHHELSEVFSLVEKGGADLGVTFSYALPKDTESLEFRKVAEERFCAVCSETHPLAAKKSVKAAELRSENYVSVGEQRSGFAKKLEEEVLGDRLGSGVLSVPSLESLFLQVRSGNGVSLVPCPMARDFGKNCAVLDIEDVDTRFDVVVFWRKDNRNPSLPLFTKLLEKA